MELQAAIEGLSALTKPCRVKITTDSKYVLTGATEWIDNWKKRNWKTAGKKQVLNADLWLQLDELIQKHEVEWAWVKGIVDISKMKLRINWRIKELMS